MSTCMGANRKLLLQLAKSEPFRLRDARELQPLNGRGGQRSRGKRLFLSVPAKGAQCPQPPVKGLSLLRKRAGQSGGRRKRRARFALQDVNTILQQLPLRSFPRRRAKPHKTPAQAELGEVGLNGRTNMHDSKYRAPCDVKVRKLTSILRSHFEHIAVSARSALASRPP